MTARKTTSLRGLALALACLSAACATPTLTPQEPRSLRTQATGTGDASVVLKTLDLTSEDLILDLEASEAILTLANPTPEALSVRALFEGTAGADTERQVASLGGETLAECRIRKPRNLGPISHGPRVRKLETPAAPRTLQATMSFTLGDVIPDSTYLVPQATRLYLGEHCAIYLDDRDTDWLSPEAAEALGRIFDTQSYPALVEAFGAEPAVADEDFNYGQDRTIFLFSREVAASNPGAAGMVDMLDTIRPELTAEMGMHSNYAKLVYLLPLAVGPGMPGTMAHEFVHVLFSMKRQQAYGAAHGEGGAFGTDLAYYLDDQLYFVEMGMNEGLAELGKFLAGYSPDEMPANADRIGRFLGQPQLLDLLEFEAPVGTQYGGMSLFNSFLYGRSPAFPRNFLTAQATGSAAIAEAMGEDFTSLHRDFTLAMALDGMVPQVPARYQIPMINLHATYNTGTGLIPLRGANDTTSPLTLSAPRPHGSRFTRVRFPSGKGKLTISGSPQLKASLILLKPKSPQGFLEE